MTTKTIEIDVNLSVKNINEIKARVIEVMDENDRLRAELDATGETLHQEIEEMQEFIDKLWKEIILKHNLDYGEWEYPDQVHRHIVAEFDDLRATIARLERQIAAKEQADDEFDALVERHARSSVLYESITATMAEADPEQQTPGERKWHLYFDGLYNEQPY